MSHTCFQWLKLLWVHLTVYVLQVLEFVDEHGNEVLNLGSFTLLPQHVVRLILARDELRADEFTKFQVRKDSRYYIVFECLT
jgi:hypothetical protein